MTGGSHDKAVGIKHVVIAYFARKQHVGPAPGPAGQKTAGASTYSHTAYHTLWIIAGHAKRLRAKHFLYMFQEISTAYRLGKFSHHACTGPPHSVGQTSLNRSQNLTGHQPELPAQLIIYSPRSIIHVGMHGVDSHIMLQGCHNGPLHIVRPRNGAQSLEKERMMRHDKITPPVDSLTHRFFSNVKTQQCPCNFRIC